MDERTDALRAAARLADGFLRTLDERPVWPRASAAEIADALGGPLPATGSPPAAVLERLAAAADPGLTGSTGSRFFGFVVGGAVPAALGADWLTSAWDQNAGISALSPAAAAVESVAAGWLLDLLGLPPSASVGFVTGAMMSSFACLAAARSRVLADVGWDVIADGLTAAPRIRFVVGADRHSTIDRAARLLGFGRNELVVVDSDDEGRMRPESLRRTLAAGDGPLIVCLQAGEVHTGAFDPFGELVPLAHEHGAWVHVDGAFGLWAAASSSTRSLVAGVEGADSWTTDAHKTLNVPYDSGLAIVRDPAAAVVPFTESPDYLVRGDVDPFERTPEFSRRARGFAVWAALASLGSDGVAALVDRLCANAAAMAQGLAAIEGVEVVNDVRFTQTMFRVADDAATRALGAALLADGTCAVTPGVWRGHAVQRCSMSSWATTTEDVDRSLAAVRRAVAAL